MSSTEPPARTRFGFIVRHPGLVLAVFLAGALALGWQVRHFEIDASADTLLVQNDPNYVRTLIMERRFAPQEFLLVAYQPRERPLFSAPIFSELRAISRKLHQLDRVDAVRYLLNVPIFSGIEIEQLGKMDPEQLTAEHRDLSPEQLRKAFDGHPLYEDLLVNQAQTATAFQVLFRSDPVLEQLHHQILDLREVSLQRELTDQERRKLEHLEERAEPLEQRLEETRISEIETIRAMLAEHEDEAAIYLGGIHVVAYQLIRIIRNDLIVFGSGIAVMICLVLLLLFGKVRWVFLPMACCGFSVVLTMGLFGLLGLKTTVISSNFIALQLILTLALVIHLMVQYREYSRAHPEWNQGELVSRSLARKAAPVFYAGLTTSVGFGSLLLSDLQPVIAFGWMMILAMFFSIGVSLMLFPAVLAWFRREEPVERGRFSRRFLDFCAGLSRRHPYPVFLAGAGLLAASVGGILQLEVENSFIDYFRERTRVHQELSFIDQQFGGSTPLDLVYAIPEADRKQDLMMTARSVQLQQLMQQALERHEAVGKILSLVNFTELAREINQDRPLTEYELTLLYWNLEGALREELLGSFFSPEHQQVRFAIHIQDTTAGLNRSELLADIRADLAELGIEEDQYQLTNLFILYQDVLQRLFRSQILTLGVVYAVLTLTFVVIFRSLRLALIGITPNILSTLAVLGAMGWLRIPLDLMTITIASIAMGIAVDSTIHYTQRYREELAAGSAEQAVTASHGSVGHAILYTSLLIILGFSLLAFSDFVPSILFGLFTSLAMALALVSNLILLPALLHRFAR